MKPFWRGVFSEEDGTPSLSRVATMILVFFACGWVTYIVRKTTILPDFTGLIMFISTIYGINRFHSGFVAAKNGHSDPAPAASGK